MIQKILDERTSNLENVIENLNEEMDIIEININSTDFSETTGGMLVRICISDSNENIYNVFLREKRFRNKEVEKIVYKDIIESVIECNTKNLNCYKGLLFLTIKADILDMDYMKTENIILDIEKARKIYNSLMDSEIYFLSKEQFEIEFNTCIFEFGGIKAINILNVIYKLTA